MLNRQTVHSASSCLKATVKDQSDADKWRIGEELKKQGYITAKQLDHAKKYQKKHGTLLNGILIKLGFIEDETVFKFQSRHFSFPPLELTNDKPAKRAKQALKGPYCYKAWAYSALAFDTPQNNFCHPANKISNVINMINTKQYHITSILKEVRHGEL